MENYRLQFKSFGKMSFLQLVKENEKLLDYFINKLNTNIKPKK